MPPREFKISFVKAELLLARKTQFADGICFEGRFANSMKIIFSIIAGKNRLALLLFLLCLAQSVHALDSLKMLARYKRVVWNTESGLPQNFVQTMTQTRDGYLWFGTQEGLKRFNGVSFKVFETMNTPTLRSNYISAMLEDRAGRLWVGTSKGLHLYKNGEFTVYTIADGLSKDFVSALYEDSRGDLWVGSNDGIDCLRDSKIIADGAHHYKLPPGERLKVIGEDAAGDLWFGTVNGIYRLRDNQLRLFTVADGLGSNSVRAIYRDAENNFWVGTDDGLSLLQNERFVGDARFKGKMVRSIKNDRAGSLWVSGEFGTSRISGGNVETLESRKDMPGGVYTILEDAEGSFWIATEGDGVWQFIDGKFTAFSTADGMISDVAFSFSQDMSGDVWVSTERGLSRFHENAFNLNVASRENQPKMRPSAIASDETGDLWVGSTKGLSRWRNGNFIGFKGSESLSKKSIQVLYLDAENNLWVGTSSGLSRYDKQSNGGEIVEYNQSEQLSKANIFSIAGSLSKGLWVGTGRGLLFLKDDKTTVYTTKDGLGSDVVMSIYEDADALWLGTFSGGLNRFKNGAFTTLTMREGLYNNIIYSILPDDAGNLWMSCNRGIFRVAKNSLTDFMDGKRQSVDSVSYGTADGMKSFECNGGYQPAALKTRDGKLWFPTPAGAVLIDPNNIRLNSQMPPVHLENMLADSRFVAMTEQTQLPAGTQRLEFQYASLSFIAPKKVRYRYRLEGFDKDWIDAGNQREAFYTNLPYGDYNFRVVADNNDGVWNETGASYAFQIKPFFYQTRWFALLCFVLAGAMIAAIHFWRVQILRLRHRAVLDERTRIARELHDTLLQGFVGVSSQLSVVAAQFQKTPEIAERHLDVARKMIRHSVTEARRAVQNLRTVETDGKSFRRLLEETVSRVTEGHSLRIEFQTNGTPFDFAPDSAHQILHIAEESIVNAVKHSDAGKIKIICLYAAPTFRLEITDDGKGFDTNNAFSTLNGHFGLLGMSERAEKAGGKLYVESAAAGGTKIVFESRSDSFVSKKRIAEVSAAPKKNSDD